MTSKKKVVIKAKDGSTFRLVHIGYVPREIYDMFLEHMVHNKEISMAEYIERWAENDFGMKITATNIKGINRVKEAVQKSALENLQLSGSLAGQCKIMGVLNAWVTDHMRKELENEPTLTYRKRATDSTNYRG